MPRRTKFSVWLIRRKWTNNSFAERLSIELKHFCHADSVANWREGRSIPRQRGVMAAIEKLTGGEITDAVLSADLKARRRS